MSIAENRHHERRHKNKAKKIIKSYDGITVTPKRIGMTSRTKASCSCWMCNKPRKVFGDPFTRAEKVGVDALYFAVKECMHDTCSYDLSCEFDAEVYL